MANPIDRIREKADAHVAKFPAFDRDGFVRWCEEHPESWVEWASRRPIASLNRSRQSERRIRRLADRAD